MCKTILHFAFCILTSAAIASGCAKARAATVPDGPPLAMPQPPPRLFGPLIEEPLPAEPVVVEAPTTEAPRVAPPPPARRTAAPPVPEKPEAAPAPAQPVPEPPRELRAASSVADAEVDRKVRAMLILAARNLGQVDYRRLTAAGREQYDQAKAFSEQAEKALTERNYVFAETLADKAAKLATELFGR